MRWLKLLKRDIRIEPFLSNSRGLSQDDVFRDNLQYLFGSGEAKMNKILSINSRSHRVRAHGEKRFKSEKNLVSRLV